MSETALAVRPEPYMNAIELRSGRVVTSSISDMMELAEIAFESRMLPQGINTKQAAFMVLMAGSEVGLGMTATLRNTYVVNGRPTFFGDLPLALCRRSPHWDESQFKEWADDKAAYCTACRKGGSPVTNSFSWDDAKRAGIIDNPMWKKYPERMRKFKARSWTLRDVFGDVLLGIQIMEDFVGSEEIVDNADPLADTQPNESAALADALKAQAGQQPQQNPSATNTAPTTGKRGRPPGSKNKPADAAPSEPPVIDAETTPVAPAGEDPAERAKLANELQSYISALAAKGGDSAGFIARNALNGAKFSALTIAQLTSALADAKATGIPKTAEAPAETAKATPAAAAPAAPAVPSAPAVASEADKADLISQVRTLKKQIDERGSNTVETFARYGFGNGKGKKPTDCTVDELKNLVHDLSNQLADLMAEKPEDAPPAELDWE